MYRLAASTGLVRVIEAKCENKEKKEGSHTQERSSMNTVIEPNLITRISISFYDNLFTRGLIKDELII